MQKYITYLGSVEPNKIDVFAERSTILSYHNECSLAAAEGSISSSIQPAQSAQQPNLSITYTVAADDTPTTIANSIISKVNIDPNFSAAGIKASPGGAGIVSLTTSKTSSVSVTVAPTDHTETAILNGPSTTLTIGGTARKGDTITLTLTPLTQPSGAASATPTTPTSKPKAAVPGAPASSK